MLFFNLLMLFLLIISASYIIDVISRGFNQLKNPNSIPVEECIPVKKCICGSNTKSYYVKVFPDNPDINKEYTGHYCIHCITTLCRNGHYVELL